MPEAPVAERPPVPKAPRPPEVPPAPPEPVVPSANGVSPEGTAKGSIQKWIDRLIPGSKTAGGAEVHAEGVGPEATVSEQTVTAAGSPVGQDQASGRFDAVSKTFPAQSATFKPVDSGWVKGTETAVGASAPTPAPEVPTAPGEPSPVPAADASPAAPSEPAAVDTGVVSPVGDVIPKRAKPPTPLHRITPPEAERRWTTERLTERSPIFHEGADAHLVVQTHRKTKVNPDPLNRGYYDGGKMIKVAVPYQLGMGTQAQPGDMERYREEESRRPNGRSAFSYREKTDRIVKEPDVRDVDASGQRLETPQPAPGTVVIEMRRKDTRGPHSELQYDLIVNAGDGHEYPYSEEQLAEGVLEVPMTDSVSLGVEGFDPWAGTVFVTRLAPGEIGPTPMPIPDRVPELERTHWGEKMLIDFIPLTLMPGLIGDPTAVLQPEPVPIIEEAPASTAVPLEVVVNPAPTPEVKVIKTRPNPGNFEGYWQGEYVKVRSGMYNPNAQITPEQSAQAFTNLTGFVENPNKKSPNEPPHFVSQETVGGAAPTPEQIRERELYPLTFEAFKADVVDREKITNGDGVTLRDDVDVFGYRMEPQDIIKQTEAGMKAQS